MAQETITRNTIGMIEGMLSCELSVVVPTRNERGKVERLLPALRDALAGITTEVIFVDDSDDDTPAVIQSATQTLDSSRFHIRCEHRPSGPARAEGMASAIARGVHLAGARYVAVVGADLQPSPEELRRLFEEAIAQDADIVMATRYQNGDSPEGLGGIGPHLITHGMKWGAKLIFPDQLLRVSDPLGGFFLLRRSLVDGVTLRPIGYALALEVLIRCQWTKLVEVPYQIRECQDNQNTPDMRREFLALLHMGRLLREVTAAGRFWKFCAVGASGFLIDLLIFALLLSHHAPLWLAWPAGTEAAILNNFAGSNLLFRGDSERQSPLLRLILYHGTAAVTTTLNLVLFLLGTLFSHGHAPLITQAVSIVGSTALGYWLAKRVVFRAHTPMQVIAGSDVPQSQQHRGRLAGIYDAGTLILMNVAVGVSALPGSVSRWAQRRMIPLTRVRRFFM
jgi:putative flippase GtrA